MQRWFDANDKTCRLKDIPKALVHSKTKYSVEKLQDFIDACNALLVKLIDKFETDENESLFLQAKDAIEDVEDSLAIDSPKLYQVSVYAEHISDNLKEVIMQLELVDATYLIEILKVNT